jgi:clan AA aspartic protease
VITGSVNAYRDAVIRLTLLGTQGQTQEIDAVIDTGFNGSLTLPQATIDALELNWRSRGSSILANDQVDACDIYTAVVLWDGQKRPLLVEATESDPLVGMRLMAGYRIVIENIDGGPVVLDKL